MYQIFHGSPIQNLKIIKPTGGLVYASNEIYYAACYGFIKCENQPGIRARRCVYPNFRLVPAIFQPNGCRLNTPCSLYELEYDPNLWEETDDIEFVSKIPAKVTSETKYDTFMQMLLEHNISIDFD